MALYLTISEGPSPGEAKPYLVTADQKLIRAVAKGLAEKLGIAMSGAKLLPLKKQNSAPAEAKQ
jgi:hypothetical protein